MKKTLLFIILLFSNFQLFSQSKTFRFIDYLKNKPNEITTFCVENSNENIKLLESQNIRIKYQTKDWLFISSSAKWINQMQTENRLKRFYFEYAPPQQLTDSSRMLLHVDEVHSGSNGLNSSYTGKNVILGFVDTGVDFNHSDLKDENGKTRVLRYWDQTDATITNKFQYYGYGRLWDSTAINNGTCTAMDADRHGTEVVGKATGNANANGRNKGIAPDAKIVMVESDFTIVNNWTLTVADACDYIFKYADSVGLPAVINLSLGTYFGSHDGNDPASQAMEQLLDEHGGRIIVAAAGNGGSKTKFHVTGNASADTSFVWFLNNPSSILGANTIYFDLWNELSDAATIDFAIGADKASPSYLFRGKTNFYNMLSSAGNVIYDTIYNSNHDRIATVELYPEITSGLFHLEVYLSHIDSTSYYYRFMTKGSGKYDLWSGSWQGLNDPVSNIPTIIQFPEIYKYQAPDSLQSIVSSWNCSEKVISVANYKNRAHHINKNGGTFTPADAATVSVGQISKSSSLGPTRLNILKPDIAAPGDYSLSSAPLWYLSNSANNLRIDQMGMHARHTGTSLACPGVAGIAALYLEKCSSAKYSTFKSELIATASKDQYTTQSNNYTYGNGKANALNLLLYNNPKIAGNTGICGSPIDLSTSISSTIDSILWNNGNNTLTNTIASQDTVFATIYYGDGCHLNTDTSIVTFNNAPSILGNNGICDSSIYLTLSPTTAYDSIIWNNGFNNDSILIDTGGNYNATIYFASGCSIDTPFETVIKNQINPISGNIGICLDPITLVASAPTSIDSIVWNSIINNDSIIISSESNNLVKYYFPSGCYMSDSVQVIENTIQPISGNIGICEDSLIIVANTTSNIDSIIWNNSISNDSLTVYSAGQNNVVYYFTSGCSLKDSTEVVQNTILPFTGNTGICIDPIIVVAHTNNIYDSIVWNNAIINDSITVSTAGQYIATFYFTSGCHVNDTVQVNQNLVLPNPIITENVGQGQLACDFQQNYQWFLNGGILINEINQILSIAENGNYSVVTTSIDGCQSTSNIILINNGIDELSPLSVYIFPNPATSIIEISSNYQILQITLTDSKGREINIQKTEDNKYSLDCLSSGIYNIKIETSQGISNSRIIKM